MNIHHFHIFNLRFTQKIHTGYTRKQYQLRVTFCNILLRMLGYELPSTVHNYQTMINYQQSTHSRFQRVFKLYPIKI